MAGGKRDNEGRMTLVEHLSELRKRIIICVIALGVTSTIVFFLYPHIIHFLSGPYEHVTKGQTACGGTKTHGCKLIVTGVLDPFLIRLKIATYGGIALAIPVVFWELWRFITPALKKNERRYGIGFLISGVVLFALGCVVAWFTVEKALEFLLKIGGTSLQPFIAADKYITLVLLMMAAFGVAFEFPILVMFLLLARVVNTRQLRQARRYVAVGVTIFAAVITPSQDPFSLLFMAVPMYIFYEMSIIVGRLLKR